MTSRPALSFVVPLFNSAQTIDRLIADLSKLSVEGGYELVLVDDGSEDGTPDQAERRLKETTTPATLIRLGRNYGEHNAVLAGLRHATGVHVVTMDDDLQNPPDEALRLWRHTLDGGFDVVYGSYARKQHAWWRNAGSKFTNFVALLLLQKPRGIYLSSFRCISAFATAEASRYEGPYVYLDGLLLQVTRSIDQIEVRHDMRASGESGYTLRKLTKLWLNIALNFSVIPLRLATLLGFAAGALGIMLMIWVFLSHWLLEQPLGWSSLMAAITLFAGAQLLVAGMLGEYIGRIYLTVNRRPQSTIRSLHKNNIATSNAENPQGNQMTSAHEA